MSGPWQLVNSQTSDNVGGRCSFSDWCFAGWRCWRNCPTGRGRYATCDKQSRYRHAQHCRYDKRGFIRASPFTNYRTRDDIYGFISSSLNFLLLLAFFFRDLFYPKGDENGNLQKKFRIVSQFVSKSVFRGRSYKFPCSLL